MPKSRRGGKNRKRLPHYKQAKIPQEKVGNYLLNPENKNANGKPEFFAQLGYNMKNERRLIQGIKKGIGENSTKQYKPDEYGRTNFEVVMEVGLTQKSKIKTIWAIDKGAEVPRFVTAYPYRK